MNKLIPVLLFLLTLFSGCPYETEKVMGFKQPIDKDLLGTWKSTAINFDNDIWNIEISTLSDTVYSLDFDISRDSIHERNSATGFLTQWDNRTFIFHLQYANSDNYQYIKYSCVKDTLDIQILMAPEQNQNLETNNPLESLNDSLSYLFECLSTQRGWSKHVKYYK